MSGQVSAIGYHETFRSENFGKRQVPLVLSLVHTRINYRNNLTWWLTTTVIQYNRFSLASWPLSLIFTSNVAQVQFWTSYQLARFFPVGELWRLFGSSHHLYAIAWVFSPCTIHLSASGLIFQTWSITWPMGLKRSSFTIWAKAHSLTTHPYFNFHFWCN